MKIKYKKRVSEVVEQEVDLPIEDTRYYFQTGDRRSIRIKPVYTIINNIKELTSIEITCIYLSFECRAEKFNIGIHQLDDYIFKGVLGALVNGWLDDRTKEQFEADFNIFINKMKS